MEEEETVPRVTIVCGRLIYVELSHFRRQVKNSSISFRGTSGIREEDARAVRLAEVTAAAAEAARRSGGGGRSGQRGGRRKKKKKKRDLKVKDCMPKI